jgi:anti-sigma B factor antagonist
MMIDVITQVHPDGCLLTVVGELDCSTASTLTEHIDSAFAEGCHAVTLDLSPVEFMDSTGVTCLLAARLHHGDGSIRIAERSSQVDRVLQLTGVDSLFSPSNAPAARTTDL